MSRDLRLYSLSLMIVLMLWMTPAHADYGVGSGCPVIAVPTGPHGIWQVEYDEEHNQIADKRELFPFSGTDAHVISRESGLYDCVLSVDAGTYYDGANHLWALDDDLICEFDKGGDFRGGDVSY